MSNREQDIINSAREIQERYYKKVFEENCALEELTVEGEIEEDDIILELILFLYNEKEMLPKEISKEITEKTNYNVTEKDVKEALGFGMYTEILDDEMLINEWNNTRKGAKHLSEEYGVNLAELRRRIIDLKKKGKLCKKNAWGYIMEPPGYLDKQESSPKEKEEKKESFADRLKGTFTIADSLKALSEIEAEGEEKRGISVRHTEMLIEVLYKLTVERKD